MGLSSQQITELYKQHSAAIYRYIFKLTHSVADTDDLHQETFLKFIENAAATEIRLPKAYLYQIAHNLVISYYQKNKKADVPLAFVEQKSNSGDHSDNWDHQLFKQEILKKLFAAKPIFSEMFILRVDQNLTHVEIAQVLKISPKKVQRDFQKIKTILVKNFKNELNWGGSDQ